MSWIDTHAHLSDAQFSADREEVLARAEAAGGERIIEIADSPAEWDAAVALSRARPHLVRCSLGLHPYYADQHSPKLLEQLERKEPLPEVVAIGEIGLDYVKTGLAKEVQREAFSSILSACLAWGKPVVVHCRGAYPDLRRVLASTCAARPKTSRFRGVIHCFSGDASDAVFCRDLGFALGVDGPVTYPKNEPLRQALREAGLECLVLETDSPYLPPQSRRGKRNEPSTIPEIALGLAQALGRPVEEVRLATTENARDLFALR